METKETKPIMETPAGKRTFVLHNEDGTERGHFTGHVPRQAALKAIKTLDASQTAPVKFCLRELDESTLHIFEGYNGFKTTPENMKKFIKTPTIKVGIVRKVGTMKINKKRTWSGMDAAGRPEP